MTNIPLGYIAYLVMITNTNTQFIQYQLMYTNKRIKSRVDEAMHHETPSATLHIDLMTALHPIH